MRFKILATAVLFVVTGCAAGVSNTTVPASPSTPVSDSKPIALTACASADAAPKNAFRSDDPNKLNSTKPKLVEFFAYW